MNVFHAPRDLLARKPPHGAPCTRCGLCCIATQCELSRHVFGERPGQRCPALKFDAERNSTCGLADPVSGATPERLAAAAHLIRAGQGCDARFNGEPRNAAFDAMLDYQDFRQRAVTKAARTTWGMK